MTIMTTTEAWHALSMGLYPAACSCRQQLPHVAQLTWGITLLISLLCSKADTRLAHPAVSCNDAGNAQNPAQI